MTRGRIGAVFAAGLVIGLFLLSGVMQRVRKADAEAETAAAEARMASPRDDAADNARRSTAASPAGAVAAAAPAAQSTRLVVAFQLDRALTQGHYLGERWVSPPSFHFAQPGDRYTVRARLQHLDPLGERTDVSGDWATGDPNILAITRLDGGLVQLDVMKPGRTELMVNAGGEQKILQVEARKTPDAMEVDFRQ